MRKLAIVAAALAAGLMFTGCAGLGHAGPQKLFNGKDLQGWYVYAPNAPDDAEPFTVAQEVIYSTGHPKGYLCTLDKHDDYVLHAEWRWLHEPGNSGILLHTQKPDRLWPTSIECQLRHNDAGDVILIGGARVADVEPQPDGRFPILKKTKPSNEAPPGQWNHADIYCTGGAIRIYINGELQNHVAQAVPAQGRIAFQSEGAPIEFRNITLEKMD